MIDPNKKEKVEIDPQDVCYRAFELMKARQYDDAEKLLNNMLARTEDETARALYHSTLGVLFKMKGGYEASLKHYLRAEKLLPRDPALKIILARLLIEHFGKYSKAIKKARRVLRLIPENPVFVHQAYTTLGLAYLGKGAAEKAVECFNRSMESGFDNFVTVKNVDFSLAEALLRKGLAVDECKEFVQKALVLARAKKELSWITVLKKMLAAFSEEEGEIEEMEEGIV